MGDVEKQEHKDAALWRSKVTSMMRTTSLTARAGSAFDLKREVDDRLAALVMVEQRLAGNPRRARTVEAVRRKKENSFEGVTDRFRNEVFYRSVALFDWCTPAEHQTHVFWVPLSTVVMTVFFFFMAGAYPVSNTQCSERWMTTPSGLGRWLIFGNSWCLSDQAWTFDSGYLYGWGARYAPAMKAQGYRWITYAFLHTGFPHYLSNIVVWLSAGWYVEKRYGTPRFFVLWLFSSVFGDMFGSICEKACTVNVGFSTGICGMVGLFFIDLVRNWRHTTFPLLRATMFGLLWISFLASFFIQRGKVSNYSHLGGFLCGLVPAALFQHHLGHEHLDVFAVPFCACATLFLTCFLPSYFYEVTLAKASRCKLT